MAAVSVQFPPAEDVMAPTASFPPASQHIVDECHDAIMTAAAKVPTESLDPVTTSVHRKRNVFDMFRLDGRVAVVTGGARGLGYSMAEGLCAAGLSGIAILDLQTDLGESACKQLNSEYGVSARFYRLDVRDEVAVQDAMDSVVRDLGKIDILVLSAGVADLVHAEDYSPAKFRRVIDINLNGSFVCAQAAGKHMIAAGRGGSIIFIGSMSGSIVNWPNPQSAYNASKAGVIHLMKSLSAEWAQHRIRCNSISPGYMDTPLNTTYEEAYFHEWKSRTPMGRLGQPEELAGCALWLASDASSFCTGSDILIDGGYTVL
ncbi:hypothetical protein V1520DRAFT_333844 [Lipomyces starkeyi]|uniref:Ketoreductase domain-containing protein n=1 Tax=Lipomyces starkeyi NRRL Y-11557 TaxID=675824 RepID=A0A1E3QDE5_LIPST|nr:hypothetical protein LIPSTDRAFT_68342 [Lipomyces starkeyi NRRL Y-11557]